MLPVVIAFLFAAFLIYKAIRRPHDKSRAIHDTHKKRVPLGCSAIPVIFAIILTVLLAIGFFFYGFSSKSSKNGAGTTPPSTTITEASAPAKIEAAPQTADYDPAPAPETEPTTSGAPDTSPSIQTTETTSAAATITVMEPETEPPVLETEPLAAEDTTSPQSYVLNTSSMKIHHSWCSSAEKIKPENRDITTDYAWAISVGYVPCKRCKP